MKPLALTSGFASRYRSRADLLAQVSTLYYLDGRSQESIAKRFRISRSKVSRLLCAARDAGIARITVKSPPGVLATLEVELEARFKLREVRIVPLASGGALEMERRKLGIAAAADFARTVKDGYTVGLVGGALLASMIDAVAPMVRTGAHVIQGVGWEYAPTDRTLMSLVWELANRIQATAVMLSAPSMPGSEAMRRGLEADPRIGDTLRTLATLDTLYVEVAPGVSRMTTNVLPHRKPVAVGHVALRHFDHRGRMLGTGADGHVVGITVEQMRRARHVVALAHGAAHAPVIAAAMRTGLIDTLITDELTARAIAALPILKKKDE